MTEETRTVVGRIRRQIKPESVVAIKPDGQRVTLGLGQLKTKWARLAGLLDGMDWAKLECYDGTGALLSTIEPDGEEEENPISIVEDPVAGQVKVWTEFMDKVAGHVRGASHEVQESLLVALQTQIERNVDLSTQIAGLQAQLMESFEYIRQGMLERVESGEALGPKEQAIIGVIDAAGQRFGGMPAGWTQLPPKKQLPPASTGADNGGKP